MGLDGILVRELVKTPERREELLGTAFWLKIIGTILMWGAILIAIFLTNNDTKTNSIIAIIAFGVVFQTFNVIDFNYQAEVKSKFVVYAQLLQLVISSIVKLILIFTQSPLIWFAWVYCLDAFVLAGGLVFAYLHNSGRILAWQWRWRVAKELLKESWVLLLYAYFVTINMNIDLVMVKHIVGNESAGYYSVAKNLSSTWYFLPVIIGSTFFPYIINRKGKATYQDRISSLFGFLSLVAIFGAIGVFYLSHFIIDLLYGYRYTEAAKILAIHIWTSVFVFHVSIRSRIFVSDNIQHLSTVFMLFGVLCNIVGNYFLIPLYGGVGAAYASWISWGMNVLFFPLFSKKCRYLVPLFLISPIKIFMLKRGIRNDF